MKAIVIKKFGDSSVLEEGRVEKPTILDNEVLIKIQASSLNPLDIKIRSLGLNVAPDLPAVLHGDFAGIIEEVGKDVLGFKKGDEVFGRYGGFRGHKGGALAEYISVPQDFFAKKPKNLSFEEAACLPCVCITAWMAIKEKIHLKQKDEILIHGGTGGVGHIGIQLANLEGAKVFTTVSNEKKAKLVKDLGVHKIINYKETSTLDYVANLTSNQGFEYIFDTVGGNNLINCFQAAKNNGTIVSINTRSTHDLSLMHNKALNLKVVFSMMTFKEKISKILEHISDLFEEGKLKVLVHEKIYTFDEIKEAHQCLEDGHHIGKIALKGWV